MMRPCREAQCNAVQPRSSLVPTYRATPPTRLAMRKRMRATRQSSERGTDERMGDLPADPGICESICDRAESLHPCSRLKV